MIKKKKMFLHGDAWDCLTHTRARTRVIYLLQIIHLLLHAFCKIRSYRVYFEKVACTVFWFKKKCKVEAWICSDWTLCSTVKLCKSSLASILFKQAKQSISQQWVRMLLLDSGCHLTDFFSGIICVEMLSYLTIWLCQCWFADAMMHSQYIDLFDKI